MPDLSLRGEVGMPERLNRLLLEGTVQMALMYTPQMRPGLTVNPVMEDDLVLVAGWANPDLSQVRNRYVFVDWGPEFAQAHSTELPDLTGLGLTLATGSMAGDVILQRGMAAYLPARFAARYIDAGQLHLVPDAPIFPFPVWVVWRDDLDADLRTSAAACLSRVAAALDQSQSDVLDALGRISDTGEVGVMGGLEP